MSTELTADVGDLLARLRAMASDLDSDATPFLKLGQKMSEGLAPGIWGYGKSNEVVDDDSLWAVHPFSFARGFVGWANRKMVKQKMAALKAPIILEADMGPLPEGCPEWQKQVAFKLTCVHGADGGIELLFKSSSYGGLSAFRDLVDKVIDRAATGVNDVIPVIHLHKEGYDSNKGGKMYNPIFEVTSWIAECDSMLNALPVPTDEEKEFEEVEEDLAPKPRTRKRTTKSHPTR